MTDWTKIPIKGILLDITGVLYESGGQAIDGSIDAVARLMKSKIPVRFCTNETSCTRKALVEKLHRFGFSMEEKDVFPPIPAMSSILKQRKLRPFTILKPEAMADMSEIDCSNPNCVVIGDATTEFSYETLNKAFQLLVSLDMPLLFSLGRGKYYNENGKLALDVGCYMKALEYACDIQAEIVGKPSRSFFNAALEDMSVSADQVVMIGDDVVNDVGGAQSCGMRGVLVRTGKYRFQDENHPEVKPDGIVDNLAQAVDMILKAL
ncbi:hypothetical protein LOTGIDRAFT_226773 [Lottia gigantea]|uniref:Phospholysine phosphohistidine inorganic pyrophosphate phosphatase n=1 Tax=Lottia gigantea TaxID=225164 RepID=V4ATW2_LOTGI|nr:hypothetical protein LOTGIDRAFT_226773 [Lottia gigantea]ESO97211.1 hypothetical protein LOTGIDRAFT_226773 [Lottia gigantea]